MEASINIYYVYCHIYEIFKLGMGRFIPQHYFYLLQLSRLRKFNEQKKYNKFTANPQYVYIFRYFEINYVSTYLCSNKHSSQRQGTKKCCILYTFHGINVLTTKNIDLMPKINQI